MGIRSVYRVFSIVWAFPFAAMFCPVAHALTVTPVQVEMTSSGAAGRTQLSVTNESKEPIPIEIAIQKMVLDETGGRKLAKAGEEFLVFPPQSLIPAGATQNFRVQWVGEPELSESQSFMLSVNQIPVKQPKGQSSVQVVMSFGVVINVAPPQGLPDLKLIGTGTEADKKTGKLHPTITVQNPTKIHGLLPQSTIKLASGSWSQTLDNAFLREKVGIGLVQPGKKRKFILPVDLPANVTQVQATLDFKPKR